MGAIVLFATINQGQALRIREEIDIDAFFGLLFVFGSWIGWVILSILVIKNGKEKIRTRNYEHLVG